MRSDPHAPEVAPPREFECFCGERDTSPVLEGNGFRVVRCRRCGACRTDPPPLEPPERMAELIEAHRRHADLFRRLLSDVLDEVLRFRTSGRFLDVGCSVGHLLDLAAERGFEPYGIELDPLAVRYARERFGERVLEVPLERVEWPRASFDVVVMNDVLEHVPRPVDLLRDARTLLKDDGVLVVGLPNFGGFARRLEGTRWYGLQPQGHIWQFTPRSLLDCLERAGLQPLRVRTHQLHRTWKPHWRQRLRKLLYDVAEHLGRGDALLVTAARDGDPT